MNLCLKIAYLFPKHLNIYGDRGNILTFCYRAKLRGVATQIIEINSRHDFLPQDTDFFFGGGGQDKEQEYVARELPFFRGTLETLVENNVPGLTICGTYQLFGRYFKTSSKTEIPGISLLNLKTVASTKRKIGNTLIELSIRELHYPHLVGFENHSGNTFIEEGSGTVPLGRVLCGFGNNGKDGWEGARRKNLIGTYLHGPVLCKNPHFADFFLLLALKVKNPGISSLTEIDDTLEWQAHEGIKKKMKYKN